MRRRLGILAAGLLVGALVMPAAAQAANPKCTIFGTPDDDFAVVVLPGEVFCGGEGNDTVVNNLGTFLGEGGNDRVMQYQKGTFIGGDGDDSVVFWSQGGYFEGGPGNDYVNLCALTSTFIGGEGNDTTVAVENGSIVVGGPGDDTVQGLGGRFIGGPGVDSVIEIFPSGTFVPGPQ